MKAIGRNLIVNKHKVGAAKTKGGLILAEKQRDDKHPIHIAEAKEQGVCSSSYLRIVS